MSALYRDLRYAIRLLRRSPVFTVFAVLSLALGLAANVAIFSVVNGVLLKPLAFREPQRLFGIVEIVPKIANLYPMLPVNPRHAAEWSKMVPAIDRMGLSQTRHVVFGGGSRPLQLSAQTVTPELLTTLDVKPLMGRLIEASDAQEGHDHVVLLTYPLWRGQLGGDPHIVGREVRIDGTPHRVIGVLPPSLRFPLTGWFFDSDTQPELFTPLWFRLPARSLEGDFNYAAIVRLKPGFAPGQALAMLNTAQAAIAKTFPDKMEIRADLIPLNDMAVRSSRKALLLVLGAVGALLLIVCLNLATLMLARGTARTREVAVRTALGASRWRLLREALLESMVLSAVGGALGVLLASAGLRGILSAAPATLPRLDQVGIDLPVLLFALVATVITALVSGLYPAWRQSRRDPQEAMAASSRSTTGSRSSTRGRSMMVAIEVALSTVLLSVAGLLLSSFVLLLKTNLGFETEHRVSAQVNLPGANYGKPEQAIVFYDKLLDEFSNQPVIGEAAVTSHLPLTGETWIDFMSRPDDKRPDFERPTTNVRFISPSYFDTMGIALGGGRTFSPSDKKDAVVVITRAVAKALWPHGNPVGQTMLLEHERMRVVGLAADTRADIDKSAPSVVYVPYWDHRNGHARNLSVVLRSSIPTRDAVSVLRHAVAKLDAEVPISQVETFGDIVSGAVSERRFQMLLIGAFAISALLIAALGIFGVIAGVVSARTNEIGIRMALGATPARVVMAITGQGMLPVGFGLAAGFVLTLAFGSVIRTLLYQVRPADPLTFAGVLLLLGGVAALACWIPARRATGIDPMTALRYE